MKKTVKKAICTILALAVILCGAPLAGFTDINIPFLSVLNAKAATIVDFGNCGKDGDNLTWTLNDTGLLTISGTGKMADGFYSNGYPMEENYFSSISSVVIEKGVTSIGDSVLKNCTELKNITFVEPSDLASIESNAFEGCTGLKNVTLPNSVKSIGNGVFCDCTGLLTITIQSVTNIGDYAFGGCTELKDIAIPDSVVNIGTSVFYGCTGLKNIIIPNGVKSIGNSAFEGCTGLLSVAILGSVTSIGYKAFSDCNSLADITIPDSVTKIGSSAFYNTAWLNNMPEGLVYAGKVIYSYKGTMPKNTEIVLAEGTKGVANSAFENCTELKSITIPDSVTNIGSFAFCHCTGLTDIALFNGITSIDSYAFDGCTGLISVAIPNSIVNIGNYAFRDCNKLSVVYYGGSISQWSIIAVESITSGLKDVKRLYNITPATHSIKDSVLFDKNKSQLIYYPTLKTESLYSVPLGVTYIEQGAFENTSLNTVILPNGVTSIGDYCFYGAKNLTDIFISNSVTSIGKSAFDYLSSDFNNVYYGGTEEQWSSVFIGSNNTKLTNAQIHYESSLCTTHTPSAVASCLMPQTCLVCGKVLTSATGHVWNEGIITMPATVNEKGVKTFTCTVCNATKTEAVPKLNAVFTNSNIATLDADSDIIMKSATSAESLLSQAPNGTVLLGTDGNILANGKLPGSGTTLVLPNGKTHTIIVMGDEDGDGFVTSADARLALRRAVGLEPAIAWRDKAGNVDLTGAVSAADARLILRAAVGLEKF